MTDIPVAVTQSANFDTGGVATVAVGPTVYGTSWVVQRYSVITSSTDQAEIRVYRNIVQDSAVVDSSYVGNQNTSDLSQPIMLKTLDRLIFQWSKGTPGAIATVTVEGIQKGR